MRGFGPHSERRAFLDVEAEIGEDPGEFLQSTSDELAIARIRGIDRIAVLDGWVEVAQELDAGDDVMEELRLRASFLNRKGERPEEFPTEDGPERYQPLERYADDPDPEEDEEAVPHLHEGCGAIVEERSNHSWYCPECDTVTNRVRTDDLTPAAADGGELA